MKVVIDGIDGTGKSTVVSILKEKYNIIAKDRGFPTLATDEDYLTPTKGEVYFILTASPTECQRRLKLRGADLEEEFHTIGSLTYYRQRFLDVAEKWGIDVIDTSSILPDKVCEIIVNKLNQFT